MRKMCFHQKAPRPPLTTSFSLLEIFRCHYITTVFFQNSPPGIDLSKDTLAPLNSKLSCQHILMTFFLRECWWHKWPWKTQGSCMCIFWDLGKVTSFHCGVVGRILVLTSERCKFKTWLYHFLSGWSWESYSISQIFVSSSIKKETTFTDVAMKIKLIIYKSLAYDRLNKWIFVIFIIIGSQKATCPKSPSVMDFGSHSDIILEFASFFYSQLKCYLLQIMYCPLFPLLLFIYY